MATSGTTIWQLTRDEIINSALRKIGVTGEGVSANATQLSEGQVALNALILQFQTMGMALWQRYELDVVMVAGQSTYTIGVGSGYDYNTPYLQKLLQANLNIPNSGSKLNMEIKAHYDFNNLPSTSTGTPVNVMYDPRINYGIFSVWPTPDASVPSGTSISLLYQQPLDVFTSSLDTADFPQEWHQAIIYGLATSLADEYGIPIADKQWLDKQAEKHLNAALSLGIEDASIFFRPNREG